MLCKRIFFTVILVTGGCLLPVKPFVVTPAFAQQNQEKELFLVAQKAFEDGFYDVAMRYIDQLLKDYPQTEKRIQANLLLGQCYFFKNQYLKAYEIFQKLLQYNDFKDVTLYWLGETYLKGGDYKQAEDYYNQVIQLYPKSIYTPQSYYSLGWVYFEQENFDKARAAFLKLMRDFPDHQLTEDAAFKIGECTYDLGEYPKAIQYFQDYIFHYAQAARQAEAYFYMGESAYYEDDPLEAVTYYAKAAEMAYDNKLMLMAHVSMGWSYLKLQKFDLAQKYFEDAEQFSQDKGILSDDIYLGEASLYSDTKQLDKALSAYNNLITKFPDSTRILDAYLGKANTYYLLEKYDEAIKTYQELIDHSAKKTSTGKEPQDAAVQQLLEKAYFGLGWSYLKKGDIDLAVNTFQTIKNTAASQTVRISALTQIGDTYQDSGQFDKAIEVYDNILKDYSDSAYADYVQYRQGIALLKAGKIEAATLSFQSLRTNFSKSKYLQDSQYYLAVAYFKKGDWTTAREYILDFMDKLSKDHPFLPEAYYILGLCYFNLNQHQDALQIFNKIIKNYPQSQEIIQNSEGHLAKCYYKLGNTEEALKRFKSLIKKYPESEMAQESLIWMGDYYLQSSRWPEAIGYYEEFLKDFPGSDQRDSVLYELGQAYQSKEEYDKAITVFKQIKESADAEVYAKAKLAIADIFSKELDSTAAIETYENIIQTSPEFKRDAYVKIAKVYKESGNYKKAIEAYSQALSAEKGLGDLSQAELQFYIADTHELLNQNDVATENYLKIPYLYPEETPWIIKAYLRVARIFEEKEQWQDAKTIYQKVLDFRTEEAKFAQERLEWVSQMIRR